MPSVRKAARAQSADAFHGGWVLASAGVLLGATLACVVQAPAAWLAQAVMAWSKGHVRLLNPEGTVWNGSAVVALAAGVQGADMQALPSRWQWQIRPAWLGLRARISADCCAQQPLNAQLTYAGLRMLAGTVRLPLAVLQGWGTPWNTLGLQGKATVQWKDLSMGWNGQRHRLEGAVELIAEAVSTKLSTLPDIGSYRIVLTGGAQPQLELATLRGALQLSGQGRWEQQKFRFEGQGSAAPESASALTNVLTLMGEQRGAITTIRLGSV